MKALWTSARSTAQSSMPASSVGRLGGDASASDVGHDSLGDGEVVRGGPAARDAHLRAVESAVNLAVVTRTAAAPSLTGAAFEELQRWGDGVRLQDRRHVDLLRKLRSGVASGVGVVLHCDLGKVAFRSVRLVEVALGE